MLNWNQFTNLPNIRPLPVNEQHRQYFIYKSDMVYRNRSNFNQSNIGGRLESSRFLLSNGIWNDSGVWDDNALWQD